jgi:hypothetical protein
LELRLAMHSEHRLSGGSGRLFGSELDIPLAGTVVTGAGFGVTFAGNGLMGALTGNIGGIFYDKPFSP